MLVQNILEQAARAYPDKSAVWFDNAWKTYAEINREAALVAAFLIGLGVKRGDRVALLLENSFAYLAAHFGVLKAGAVDVSLNTELTGAGLQHLLLDCGAVVLIAGAKFHRQWSGILDDLPALKHVLVDQKLQEVSPDCSGVCRHFLADVFRGELQPFPDRKSVV